MRFLIWTAFTIATAALVAGGCASGRGGPGDENTKVHASPSQIGGAGSINTGEGVTGGGTF